MTEGIKVDGGDKLGKTIIFAKNHDHAVFIEERFNKNYPEYSGKFLRVIDNYETKAQDLLEKFTYTLEEEEPQIAVSVDMMDTGVDAPRVVNLVFFKMVRSATKFWQMIGRGTRLFPDLFGPGQDKEFFLILDYCENFEFFESNPDGYEAKVVKSLSQQVFEAKLLVAYLIGEKHDPSEADNVIRNQYLDELHRLTASLDQSRFVVKGELKYVTAYTHKDKWNSLSRSSIDEINTHLSHLPVVDAKSDELARRFDILMLNYQLALLDQVEDTGRFMGRIDRTARLLQKKANIPAIQQEIELIKEVQTKEFWEGVDLAKLDKVRTALRDLIKYLDKVDRQTVVTHFEDFLDKDGAVMREPIETYLNLKDYRDRVESYIRKNVKHIAIAKLRTNVPIIEGELNQLEELLFVDSVAGTREVFEKEYGEQPLGQFVRQIVGLDIEAANKAFSAFLQAGNLRADQMTFVQNIVSYLAQNGTMDRAMLYEVPFTDVNDQGISGVFDDAETTKIVKIIDDINSNASMVA